MPGSRDKGALRSGRKLIERNKRDARKQPLCARCLTGHCAHRSDGQRCFRAGQETDHIVPLAHGGKDTPENRQRLCKKCHKLKTDEDFKRYRKIGPDGWPVN
jgi:5-methylcytosine-specific restriction endonuclease McrA